MSKTESIRELANALKDLFQTKRGEFRLDDLIEVCRVFGLEALEKAPTQKTLKMLAKNHFADIAGINLQYALETYEWEGWRPITDDGVTVAGFWDSSKSPEVPQEYILDESEKYLKKIVL